MDDRIVEVKIENHRWNIETWLRKEFKDIKKGETFRLRESDTEEIVKDKDGKTEWKATSDAFLNKDNVWAVDY